MARPTYTARGIVLRKTKLGEMDLIVELLARDGSQLRAVARGARKPGGSFAGKLELCNTVDVLCSQGPGLDSVKEARLVTAHPAFMADVNAMACAACVAETVERMTEEDLPHGRLFDLVGAALMAIERADGISSLYVTAAALLKVFALTGIMPRFSRCALCGEEVDLSGSRARFSIREGGTICEACSPGTDAHGVVAPALKLAQSLLMATFDAILITPADQQAAQQVLEFCRDWFRFHVGPPLRSLSFLMDIQRVPADPVERTADMR